MKQLIGRLIDLTNQGEPFVFATVVGHHGSAPQSAGAKMLIEANGDTTGTIGGGIMEAKVRECAISVFQHKQPAITNFKFNGKDATSKNAICGGEVDVLVEWINPTKSTLKSILDSISSLVANNKKAWLLTSLPELSAANRADPMPTIAHLLVQEEKLLSEEKQVEIPLDKIHQIRRPVRIEADRQNWMVEPLHTDTTVYIFGSGHIGRSLATFTQTVDFKTVVLDDRFDFTNPHLVPIAGEVIVLDSFDNALKDVQIDSNSFIVIVTRDHLNDRKILSQVLNTIAGFIGMVGSSRKCRLIYDELRKEGFNDLDFQRVHAPIGLPINADTPEEISISIVAEMIKARAEIISS